MKETNQEEQDLSELLKKLQKENPNQKVVLKIVPPAKVGLIMCFIGGFASMGIPEIGAFLIAYGVVIAAANRDEKARARAAIMALLPILVNLTSADALVASQALVVCMAGFALSGLVMQDKASISNELLFAGFISAIMLFLNVSYIHQTGSGVQEYVLSNFDKISKDMFEGMSVQQEIAIANAREIYTTYWPLAICSEAFILTVFARWGATKAAKMLSLKISRKSFTEYDNPLWLVVLLIIGIVAVKMGGNAPQYSKIIVFIGHNILGIVRILFAIQGYAVGLNYLKRYPSSIFLAFAYVVLAISLEVNYMIVSIVGLVDVWANFRGLDRQN